MRPKQVRMTFWCAFSSFWAPQLADAAPLPDPIPCSSCFIGDLRLADNPADSSGNTKLLLDDLYFVDPDRFVWKAAKDDVTDGASIPGLFQPIVGGPFEASYLPAAVIHDHYTDKSHRVRPWRDTARVFYQAMIVKGVNVVKAKTMYFAVYSFGPHWDVLAQGIPCGKNCIFSAPIKLSVQSNWDVAPSAGDQTVPLGMRYAEQAADYGLEHSPELETLEQRIAAREIRGEPFTLDELEILAKTNHSDNVFIATDNSK